MALLLKMAGKVPTLRERGNSLTLGEAESLALWRTVNDLVWQFGPCELAMGLWMLEEIDRQKGRHVSLMRANSGGQRNQIRR